MNEENGRGVEIRARGRRYIVYLDGHPWEDFEDMSEAKHWRDVIREKRKQRDESEEDSR